MNHYTCTRLKKVGKVKLPDNSVTYIPSQINNLRHNFVWRTAKRCMAHVSKET